MKLQQIEPGTVKDLLDFPSPGIHEQAHGHDKRRQKPDQRCGLLGGQAARALFDEHKTQGMHPQFERILHILCTGHSTKFDPGWHAIVPRSLVLHRFRSQAIVLQGPVRTCHHTAL